MQLRKHRWSKDYESAEEELVRLLTFKKIAARRWLGTPDQIFAAHTHQADTRIWCVEGSLKYVVGNQTISMQPGDTLDLPADTSHEVVVGFTGCVCYEISFPTNG